AELDGVVGELERGNAAAAFPLDAGVAIERLTTLGLLVLHRGERVGFRHALIRDGIEETIPPERRRNLHHAAFRFYRSATWLPPARRLPLLALHASGSGLDAEAARLYLDLAEQARGRHAYVEAEAMYSRSLDLVPANDTRRRTVATRGRGLMRYRLGRDDDALGDLGAAPEQVRTAGDAAAALEMLLDQATGLDWAE